jgi:hypothetical protein
MKHILIERVGDTVSAFRTPTADSDDGRELIKSPVIGDGLKDILESEVSSMDIGEKLTMKMVYVGHPEDTRYVEIECENIPNEQVN